MRKILLAAALMCGFSLLAQTNHDVDVTSNQFTPEILTITVGDMVTWTNLQGTHNVNGSQGTYPNNPESFGNAVAPVGWVYSHTFNIPGTYDYRCDPHFGLGMSGQVIVEPAAANGNVVITEIMYNPPEGGADSLEYVELFNAGPGAANLNGWSVTEGFELADFGDVTIEEGGYLILAVNASAFVNTFNYNGTVIQWEDGALGNGGEDIEIQDANSNVVDLVDYDDMPLWPLGTDGEGASLILCDVSADNNNPLNWQASTNSTGVTINEIEILGSPGAANSCGTPEPTVFWIDDSYFEDEDAGEVRVQFVRQNIAMAGEVAMVELGTNTTATATEDYNVLPPLPTTYGTNGPLVLDTVEIIVTILEDTDVEDNEVIELSLSGLNGVNVLGEANLTITIFDNDSEVVVTPIGDINGVDANGVTLFEDSIRTLQGVVHCLDFDGNDGYQFWIVEPLTTDGIFVFSGSDVDSYQLTEGDELQITGELTQFRGLLEIVPNNIEVISTGNALVTPEVVDDLFESVESKYVTLELSTQTPTTDFIVQAGGGNNVTVVAANGDTVNVRVEFDTDIDSTFIADFFISHASNGISITGMVSQRDFDAPFDDFYQLYPCSQADFNFASSVAEPTWAADMMIYPNPAKNQLTVDLPIVAQQYRLMDGFGRVAQFGQVNAEKIQLNLTQLPKGVYYLQIMDGADLVTRPIVKQ